MEKERRVSHEGPILILYISIKVNYEIGMVASNSTQPHSKGSLHLQFGQAQGVKNLKGFKIHLLRSAGSLCTAFEPDTTDTIVGSKREVIDFPSPPPVRWVAGTRANNHCLVPIASAEITVLIFGRSMVHPRVVNAWTTRTCPSGKAKSTKWRSAALAILVDEETHTGARLFARNVFFIQGRIQGNSVLVVQVKVISYVLGTWPKLFIVVSACELHRTRPYVNDLYILASVDFEIPALIPIPTSFHARIIRFAAGAGKSHDSSEDERSNESVQ
jgi:hypothetical protein